MKAIGVDIGGTSVKMALTQDDTNILQKTSFPFDRDPRATAENIYRAARQLRQSAPDAKIGVSCAGSVENGVVWADNLAWHEVDISAMLSEKFGQRVPVANDAFCALTAEWRYGALRDVEHAVYLTIGTGIGGAIIANGRTVRGVNGIGGELGHMITHVNGLECACSQKGCYEMYASARALSRMGGGMPVKEIVSRVEKGEMADVWREYLSEVCAGLLSMMAIFAPSVIALGGGLSNAGDVFYNGVMDTLNATRAYARLYGHVSVCLGRFRNDAGVIGAAQLARQ